MDTKSVAPELRIGYPVEEELLAACEYALEWFEVWVNTHRMNVPSAVSTA